MRKYCPWCHNWHIIASFYLIINIIFLYYLMRWEEDLGTLESKQRKIQLLILSAQNIYKHMSIFFLFENTCLSPMHMRHFKSNNPHKILVFFTNWKTFIQPRPHVNQNRYRIYYIIKLKILPIPISYNSRRNY
jgi:hypothetical protein